MRTLWRVVPVLALASSVGAQPAARVLSFDKTRSEFCGNSDTLAFADGGVYATARAMVLDPAYFGPGGIVSRALELAPSVDALTPESLADIDIVLINELATPLNECERRTLKDFVDQGGGLFAFGNHLPEMVGDLLGAGAPGDYCGAYDIAFTEAQHPVLQGPFGQLSGPFGYVWHCMFEDVGADGTAVLQSKYPMGAAFSGGGGHSVVIGDDEWLMEGAVDCPASPFWGKPSAVLLLNSLAFVMPKEDFEYKAPTPCYANCDGSCSLDLFDFLCFTNLYNAGSKAANCDGDGELSLFDFLCFTNAFNTGC